MIEAPALKAGEKVLEIALATSYAAAVLSRTAKEVFTIELVGPNLAEKAAVNLSNAGYTQCSRAPRRRNQRDRRRKRRYAAILVSAARPCKKS